MKTIHNIFIMVNTLSPTFVVLTEIGLIAGCSKDAIHSSRIRLQFRGKILLRKNGETFKVKREILTNFLLDVIIF